MILMLMLLIGIAASAQQKNKNAKYDIAVSGNCDMCKKRIEKAAFAIPGVKSAQWHADDQILHVILNEEKTSAEKVAAGIAKAGHDAGGIRAADADYNALHGCCQYERKAP